MPESIPDLVILNANELVTLNSKSGIPRKGKLASKLDEIKDGAVAIKKDEIMFVGTTPELKRTFNIKDIPRVINAEGKLVTPGLVDPHTHVIFDGSREDELEMKLKGMTYMEILKAGGGILKTVRATRKAPLEKLVSNGMIILDSMLSNGTTTVEIKSGYGLTVNDEIKMLRATNKLNDLHPIDIIPTFLGAHAIPPEYEQNADKYVDLIINEMIPLIAKEKLAEFSDVFCEKGIFSIDQTKRILLASRKHGMKIQIHVDEIVDTGGARLAAELDAIQAGHLLKSNVDGLKEMAKNGVIATLLPGTPFCLMLKEYAPARKMVELEVPIALATDLNPNCWIESMQLIMVLACYNMKLTPAEALVASTINAACAIQKQDEIGSLEVGKKADLVIFNVPNHNFLTYKFGTNLVNIVIKNGEEVVNFKEKPFLKN